MKIVSCNSSNIGSEIGGADNAYVLGDAIGSLPCLHLIHSKLILVNHLVVRKIIWNEIVVFIHVVYITKDHTFFAYYRKQGQIWPIPFGCTLQNVAKIEDIPMRGDIAEPGDAGGFVGGVWWKVCNQGVSPTPSLT